MRGSQRAQHLKTYLMIGYAPSVASPRTCSGNSHNDALPSYIHAAVVRSSRILPNSFTRARVHFLLIKVLLFVEFFIIF